MYSYAVKLYTHALYLNHIHVHSCHIFAGYFDISVALIFFCVQHSVTDLTCISQQALQVLVWNQS